MSEAHFKSQMSRFEKSYVLDEQGGLCFLYDEKWEVDGDTEEHGTYLEGCIDYMFSRFTAFFQKSQIPAACGILAALTAAFRRDVAKNYPRYVKFVTRALCMFLHSGVLMGLSPAELKTICPLMMSVFDRLGAPSSDMEQTSILLMCLLKNTENVSRRRNRLRPIAEFAETFDSFVSKECGGVYPSTFMSAKVEMPEYLTKIRLGCINAWAQQPSHVMAKELKAHFAAQAAQLQPLFDLIEVLPSENMRFAACVMVHLYRFGVFRDRIRKEDGDLLPAAGVGWAIYLPFQKDADKIGHSPWETENEGRRRFFGLTLSEMSIVHYEYNQWQNGKRQRAERAEGANQRADARDLKKRTERVEDEIRAKRARSDGS